MSTNKSNSLSSLYNNVRVGRRIYQNSSFTDPSYDGFIPIICLTKSTKYGDLGPYVLRDNKNRIIENVWQASKYYKYVPKVTQRESRWSSHVIWSRDYEVHENKDGKPNSTYLKWRKDLSECKYPVRYPVGQTHRHECICCYKENNDGSIAFDKSLDYIQSRKAIYIPLYQDAVHKENKFNYLRDLLKEGKKLLIIEVDGPHEESLQYYKDKYNVVNNFIENDTIVCYPDNLRIMLNDEKHPFGHGYCLAMSLLGLTVSDIDK